jgi:uncharacterized protein
MSSLASSEKQLLLEVARRALTGAAEHRDPPEDFPSDEALQRPAGAFVTLRQRSGRLRGCIGQFPSQEPLVHVVARCAKAAALEDPRFDAVRPEELAGIDIELSVLSPLEEIAPDKIEAGKHGLVVSAGGRRGVLLPQVATEHRWTAQRLLEETCIKAGVDRKAWMNSETRVEAFTAEVFSEADFRFEEMGRPGYRARTKPGYSSST